MPVSFEKFISFSEEIILNTNAHYFRQNRHESVMFVVYLYLISFSAGKILNSASSESESVINLLYIKIY